MSLDGWERVVSIFHSQMFHYSCYFVPFYCIAKHYTLVYQQWQQ